MSKRMKPAPYRFDSDYSTPPPFRVCHECEGKGHKKNHKQYKPGSCAPMEYACKKCEGLGRIPIYYTIQQWEELTGRKVPDDMPVWYYSFFCDSWISDSWGQCSEVKRKKTFIVIANEASRPQKDWRPE